MSAAPEMPLTVMYHEWMAATVDEDGFEMPYGLVLDDDGQITVMALALTPDQAYQHMLKHWTEHRPAEMIFAIDRYAKPGQGTTLRDLMAGWHFIKADPRPRPFVVEYQFDPRLVKPIEWDNLHWNAALTRELSGHLRHHLDLPFEGGLS